MVTTKRRRFWSVSIISSHLLGGENLHAPNDGVFGARLDYPLEGSGTKRRRFWAVYLKGDYLLAW
jgi:hypothetical protein